MARYTYSILEDWHNGCDNGSGELLSRHDTLAEAREALETEIGMILSWGLGDEFGPIRAGESLGEYYDGPMEATDFRDNRPVVKFGGLSCMFWYGTPTDDDSGFWSSERRRAFRIVMEALPEWEFRYDEEHADSEGRNFAGIISDGMMWHVLFWHAFMEEGGTVETCHVYSSLVDLYSGENEVVSYPWTPENDSALLVALNALGPDGDFCSDSSPIRTLEFKPAGR